MNPTLPRSTPEAQGIPSAALAAFLDGTEAAGLELHSFMLLRHAHVVAEGWWAPYNPDGVQLLYSLSKSFTATAVGLAVHEGRLSVDDPVLGFFPDEAPRDPHPHLEAMRVRHLLSMTTGHVEDTLEPAVRGSTEDWVRGFLALPPEREPGSVFTYNNGATFMLSAIVQRVTGLGLLEYLTPRLLGPLGITGARWDRNAQGIDYGFSGLHLSTEAVARFGQLYLQRGVWQGQQLVPEAWVEEASRFQTPSAPPSDDSATDWAQGYGYQFWRCRHGAYRGDGAFGQFCVLMPEEDAVLIVTSAVETMQTVLDLAWAHLLPAMQGEPLAEEVSAHEALVERLANASLPPVQGSRTSAGADAVSGVSYRFDPAEQVAGGAPSTYAHFPVLESATLTPSAEGWTLELSGPERSYRVACGYGHWTPGDSTFYRAYAGPVRVSGAWTEADTFTLKVIYLETPHTLTLSVHVGEGDLHISPRWNVQFGTTALPTLSGERSSVSLRQAR